MSEYEVGLLLCGHNKKMPFKRNKDGRSVRVAVVTGCFTSAM